MQTNQKKLITLLEPHFPAGQYWDSYQTTCKVGDILEGNAFKKGELMAIDSLFEDIIYLLTHTKEGKPCKDGDVPCVLGELVSKYQNPKTKAQAFLSYENLQLATTDFEAFCKLLIAELENSKKY